MVHDESPEQQSRELPFGFSRRAYDLALQRIPIRDLRAEIEAAQWLALDLADVPGDSRAVAEIQLERLVAEMEHRKQALADHPDDPLRPAWPRQDASLRSRVEAVKARWPIERFCRDLLGCDLKPAGQGKWTARCPLPGHDDRTPSFTIYETSDSAHCFGCNRRGDIIALTGYALGLERFYEKLDRLERERGLGGAA